MNPNKLRFWAGFDVFYEKLLYLRENAQIRVRALYFAKAAFFNLLKLLEFGRSSLTAVALLSSVLRDFEPSVLLEACVHQNSNFFTSFTETRKIKISAQNLVWKKGNKKVALKRNF